MLKCSKKRVGFVHVPKTGGTSVSVALMGIADTGQLEGIADGRVLVGPRYMPHAGLLERAHVHTFTVVRNPWSRYVSRFRGKRSIGHPLYQGSFAQWIEVMGECPPIHVQDQCSYIVRGDELVVDTVLRFETLAQDFAEFSDRFGLGVRLPERRYRSTGTYDYRTYYTDDVLEAIEPRVSRDAKLFGYTFERLG